MTIRAFQRGVLWFGLGGTLVLVLGGYWVLIARVWADSLVRTLEVLVAGPFLGIWLLSPILWAAWPRRNALASRSDELTAAVAAVLLVGVGVCFYVSEFVVLPLVFGVEPGLDSLVVAVTVPLWQWGILGVAAVVHRFCTGRPGEQA